jgi:AbrB family looped-hinge helix DNA binding protein
MIETVTMDKFGRVLIPKRLREQLRLEPDQPLELRSQDGELTLRPTSHGELVEKEGLLVWVSKNPVQGDLREILESTREERVDSILENI